MVTQHSFPSFDGSAFTQVTEAMKAAFERDGFLVLDQLISAADCQQLINHMQTLVAGARVSDVASVFSSVNKDALKDDYLLKSANEISFFLEEGAVDSSGELLVPLEKAINKVGHALHDLDPVFNRFSRQPAFKALCDGLGMQSPVLMQSMYIFKQAGIGGEVKCHQDAPFLWTEPQSVLGVWVALEEATLDNGCLWGIAGQHHESAPRSRFCVADGVSDFVTLDDRPWPEEEAIPLPVKAGTVIILHGQFPHLSAANRSQKSRQAYALHVVDGQASYSPENWLQRSADFPATGFDQ